ncbi:hypothetical protein BCR33DRAFT_786362 [Rhizoclosmatium globosum]|uniref:SWIM-type domain-containing protein n=1 Tax=Rhizoclosmatium globosum TaxID=329046 RepID=A0A1Y2C6I0_9FUNG|nr:hypothetical protein BCR33DRAFT_786362 [Rhizoclosmatium globosum]|eukprot:ORY42653.1 hypothetical protein BCR33DRAFT_786362 [Rhizoclosmatium globosum]
MLNLPKNLKPKLGSAYQQVSSLWWNARNSVSENGFELVWKALINAVETATVSEINIAAAIEYLQRLYRARQKWSLAWVHSYFTLRQHTSGRVEKHQDIIKRGRTGSLLDLILFIEDVSSQLNDSIELFENNHATRYPTETKNMITRVFDPVLKSLTKYTSHWFQNESFKLMSNSLFYKCESSSLEAIRDDSNSYLDGINEDDDKNVACETRIHSRLLSAASLAENLRKNRNNPIQSIFKVEHVHYTKAAPNFIFVLSNGASVCTCLLQINCGLFCSHFYATQLANRDRVLFNIEFIPLRLLKDNYQLDPPLGQFLGVGGETGSIIMPLQQDDMDSKMKDIMIALKTTRGAELAVETKKAISEKAEYANFMAAAKKKFEILKAEGSDSVVKETEQMQRQILERLPIAQALDLPQKRGKGRPSTKRKTSSVESNKTRVGARRKPRKETQVNQENQENQVSYRRKRLRSK